MKPDEVAMALLEEVIVRYELIRDEFSHIGPNTPRFAHLRIHFLRGMFQPLCGKYEKGNCCGCPLAYSRGEYFMGRCYGTLPYTEFLHALWVLDLAIKRKKPVSELQAFFHPRITAFISWLKNVRDFQMNPEGKISVSVDDILNSIEEVKNDETKG